MKSTVTSCWRRRTFTNKILPALVQAFVVVSAWEVLTSLLPSSNESKDISNNKNIRSVGQPSSPAIDTSRATTLRLLDLSSVIYIAEQPSHGLPPTYHLKTTVYVRDERLNSLNLYPVGTLVNFGNLKASLVADGSGCAQQSSNADVGDDQESFRVDIDANDDTVDRTRDTPTIEEATSLSSSRGGVSGAAYDYVRGNLGNQAGNIAGSDSRTANIGAGQDFARFKPDLGRDQQRNADIRNQINFNAPQNPQESVARDVSFLSPQWNKQPDAGKMTMNVVKSQPDTYHYMKMMDQSLTKSLVANVASQNQDRNSVPDYNSQYGYQGHVQTSDQQFNNPNFENVLLSRGIMVDETGEKLYADGFLDRVNKLTSELFGVGANKSAKPEMPINLLINSPNACRNLKNVEVLFLINSLPQNVEQRQLIRDTYLNTAHFPEANIVYMFMIGRITSPSYDQRLNQEQVVHEDIVQGDFIDVPDNATLKGLMGLRWVTHFCLTAKYIMKINEDVFVDTDKLMRGLLPAAKIISGKRQMLCYFNPESAIARSGPNSVRDKLFPGRTRLRPFCKGFAVLLTRGAVMSIVAASEYVHPIYLDELYLYGILPFVAGSIDVYDVGAKRAFNNFGLETMNCYKTLADKCPIVASVAFNERFTTLWSCVEKRMGNAHSGWEKNRSLWNIPDYKRRF